MIRSCRVKQIRSRTLGTASAASHSGQPPPSFISSCSALGSSASSTDLQTQPALCCVKRKRRGAIQCCGHCCHWSRDRGPVSRLSRSLAKSTISTWYSRPRSCWCWRSTGKAKAKTPGRPGKSLFISISNDGDLSMPHFPLLLEHLDFTESWTFSTSPFNGHILPLLITYSRRLWLHVKVGGPLA